MTVLAARDLVYTYPRSENGSPFRLEGVTLDVGPGDLVAVLGPNGAGKSTLLRLLSGARRPQGGGVFLDGRSLSDHSPREIARRIAWVPQEMDSLFPLSVEEMVSLGRACRTGFWGRRAPEDRVQVDRALCDTDLTGLRHRRIDRLSGGERRRTLLARALAQEPAVVLLDEPTAHLDPRHQADLVATLERLRRGRGLAVVATLHDVNLAAEWCPRALLLKDGRAAAFGPVAEALSPRHLESVFGVTVRSRTGFWFGPPPTERKYP